MTAATRRRAQHLRRLSVPNDIDDRPKANAGVGWGEKRRSSGRVFDLDDYEVQQHLAEEAIYG